MWISVHDSVDGPKLRALEKTTGCSRGEAIGVLTALWLWGARNENTDQSGLIRTGDEDDLAIVILPYLTKGTDSRDFVEKMIEAGWIDRLDGRLYFHDWEDWQGPLYKYKRERERDKKRKRAATQRELGEVGDGPPKEKPVEPDEGTPGAAEPEPKPKKPKKTPKPKPEKKQYAEFVTLTEDEYGKLVERYGEEATKRMIEVLDNYKGQSGKKYESDYRAILNWVWERVRDENPRLIKPQAPPPKPTGGLSDIIPDEWRRGRG